MKSIEKIKEEKITLEKELKDIENKLKELGELLNKKKDGFDEHLDQLLQFRNIPSLVTSMRIVIMMMKRK